MEELKLIPGITDTAPREIIAKRPWKTLAQFNIDFAKSASQALADRWVMYVYIPMNANSASDADLATIPGGGAKAAAEIKAHRPYSSKAQFETEVGKGLGAAEAAQDIRVLRALSGSKAPRRAARLHRLPGEEGLRLKLYQREGAIVLSDAVPVVEARTGQRILERYGMSEAVIITSNPLDGERIAGSVGYPLPGVALRIDRESTRLNSSHRT